MKIKSIELKNFMGIAKGRYDFDNYNEITAKSGEGKSTLRYAYLWVLNQKVDNIAPCKKELDKISNEIILDLDIEVEVVIEKDEKEYVLKRQAKIESSRNEETLEKKFKGIKANTFIIGENTFNAKNYDKELENIFGVEIEKLPLFLDSTLFMGETAKWGNLQRKQFLVEPIKKDIAEEEYKLLEEYPLIKSKVDNGVNIDQLGVTLKNNYNKLVKDRKNNAIKYDEYMKKLADLPNPNYEELENELQSLNKQERDLQNAKELGNVEVDKIKSHILKVENDIQEEKNKKYKADREFLDKVDNQKNKVNKIVEDGKKLKQKIADLEDENTNYANKVKVLEEDEKFLLDSVDKLLEESEKVIKLEISNDELLCPYCSRELESKQREKALENFEAKKQARLKEINDKANYTNNEIKTIRERISSLKSQIKNNEEKITQTTLDKESLLGDYGKEKKIYETLVSQSKNPYDTSRIEELVKLKQSLEDKLEEEKRFTVDEDTIEIKLSKLQNRKAEINELLENKVKRNFLKESLEEIANQNKELIKNEQETVKLIGELKEYNSKKMNIVSSLIQKFMPKKISFSMYEFQPTAKEEYNEYKEICELVFENKVYSSLSTGEKVHANYLLQLGLQRLYQVDFPVWIEDYEISQRNLGKIDTQRIAIRNDKDSTLGFVKINDVVKE